MHSSCLWAFVNKSARPWWWTHTHHTHGNMGLDLDWVCNAYAMLMDGLWSGVYGSGLGDNGSFWVWAWTLIGWVPMSINIDRLSTGENGRWSVEYYCWGWHSTKQKQMLSQCTVYLSISPCPPPLSGFIPHWAHLIISNWFALVCGETLCTPVMNMYCMLSVATENS